MADEAQTEETESEESAPVEEVQAEHIGGVTTSNWEFIDSIPTPEDVWTLLSTLKPVYGVQPCDYADFVVGLPSTKKMKVPDGNRKVEKFFDVVTLYMGVAGRMKMIADAAEMNGWCVNFVPEPVTPTGVPGMLQMDDRIVYREYVEIEALRGKYPVDGEDVDELYRRGDVLGRRPGTAWVPSTGGKQAAGSNPYEKVETAARGRAIAAWGFGVLPGSGVASLEEMLGSAYNRKSLLGGEKDPEKVDVRLGRNELIEKLLMETEIVRQLRQVDQSFMLEKLAVYFEGTFGIEGIRIEDGETVTGLDWVKAKDGMLQLGLNQMMAAKIKLQDEMGKV